MRLPIVNRLAPTDLAVLWPEDFGWPQDVGLLAILDGAGGLDVQRLRCHVASRLGLLPARFRQLLVRPRRGLGRPYWVDADGLDLDYHVRATVLPAGAGERQLLAACEAVRRRRFDAAHPRWHLTLVEGLPDGRVGLLMDVHHCLVDGISGIAALGAFIDVPGLIEVPKPAPPRQAPAAPDLFVDAVAGTFRTAGRFVLALCHPRRLWGELARDVAAWRRTTGGGPAPATSLNRSLGRRRRYALVRGSLAAYKAIARAHDATVNDVLLCALAGGLRALLVSRGERVDGLVLRAAVPVSLHADDGQAQGNHAGGLLLMLPVGEADPPTRLRRIARDSAERKRNAVLPGAASPFFSAALVQRLVIRLAAQQRLSNSYLANVPGPPVALSLAGACILEVYPLVPLLGNLTVGVGALSYAGQLTVTVVADADACTDIDVDVLATAVERELVDLAQTSALATAAG